MSALPPKADMLNIGADVCFVPIADFDTPSGMNGGADTRRGRCGCFVSMRVAGVRNELDQIQANFPDPMMVSRVSPQDDIDPTSVGALRMNPATGTRRLG